VISPAEAALLEMTVDLLALKEKIALWWLTSCSGKRTQDDDPKVSTDQ
jgi:hypothetical protein